MEKRNDTYQYRIYPNEEQRELFAKTFGCCRKVYNLMLSDKIDFYKVEKKTLRVTPAKYKKEFPYLKEVDSLALANEQLRLEKAYQDFFRDKKRGFPKFKSKKTDRNSYTTNCVNGNLEVFEQAMKLPKVGKVKAKIHRKAPDFYKLKSITIAQERDGTYYASVLYEYEVEEQSQGEWTSHIGLDYKSNGLYMDNLGNIANMPHYYRLSQKKLGKAQRKCSKMEKGSNNYKKQKRKVAKIARHTANQRKDFLHKKSNEITNQYDIISVEDLNMRGMARSLKLGKATLDNGYGMFVSMMKYKQDRKGHILMRVDKFYPSSQLCQCGYKNPITKDLKIRIITCPSCGETYDRDKNAAINIDKEGLRMLFA